MSLAQAGIVAGTGLAGAALGGKGGKKSGLSNAFNMNTGSYNLKGSGGDRNYAELNMSPDALARMEAQNALRGDLQGIRGQVVPGFGRLTAAARANIENARSARLGNLRDTLAQRRLTGSSFGESLITQAEREFGQAQNEAESQSILQEIATSSALIEQENSIINTQVQQALSELGIVAGVSQNFTNSMNQLGQMERMMAAQEQAGLGKFIGQLGGMALGSTMGPKVTPPEDGGYTPPIYSPFGFIGRL
jgi:hypothetical protein